MFSNPPLHISHPAPPESSEPFRRHDAPVINLLRQTDRKLQPALNRTGTKGSGDGCLLLPTQTTSIPSHSWDTRGPLTLHSHLNQTNHPTNVPPPPPRTDLCMFDPTATNQNAARWLSAAVLSNGWKSVAFCCLCSFSFSFFCFSTFFLSV